MFNFFKKGAKEVEEKLLKDASSEYIGLYSEFLKSNLKLSRPLKLVADCSNGTSGIILKNLLNVPNLTLTLINENPNPDFPAHGPNPLKPKATDQLVSQVKKLNADVGVIFDADADRAFFVDDKGRTLTSFIIAILLFRNHQPPYVADETVFKSLQHLKLFSETELFPCRVGSYFIKNELRHVGASCAAEFSGHYYFKEFFNCDSGIFSMVQVLNALSQSNQSLSDWYETIPKHQLQSLDLPLTDKTWPEIDTLIDALYASNPKAVVERRDGITIDFGDGWINARLSNTEPLVRLIAGSSTEAESISLIEKLAEVITQD